MNNDSRMASVKPSKELNANGLNHSADTGTESGLLPLATEVTARITNSARARYCTPSSTFCSFSPISTPR